MIKHIIKTYKTTSNIDIIDVTNDAQVFVEDVSIANGLLTLVVPGSTASITTIEYEPGVVEDLRDALWKIAPPGKSYKHDAAWGDGNGYSHVLAALVGASLTLPIVDGRLMLGTWQQIVLCDFDNKPRHRKVIMHIMGE